MSEKKAARSSPNGAKKKSLKGADSSYVDPEQLLAILTAVSDGDFSRRLPSEKGIVGDIYDKAERDHRARITHLRPNLGASAKSSERKARSRSGLL
jgi:hypothetical protein